MSSALRQDASTKAFGASGPGGGRRRPVRSRSPSHPPEPSVFVLGGRLMCGIDGRPVRPASARIGSQTTSSASSGVPSACAATGSRSLIDAPGRDAMVTEREGLGWWASTTPPSTARHTAVSPRVAESTGVVWRSCRPERAVATAEELGTEEWPRPPGRNCSRLPSATTAGAACTGNRPSCGPEQGSRMRRERRPSSWLGWSGVSPGRFADRPGASWRVGPAAGSWPTPGAPSMRCARAKPGGSWFRHGPAHPGCYKSGRHFELLGAGSVLRSRVSSPPSGVRWPPPS